MEAAIPDLSFVLPAHNEAHNIGSMAKRLREVAGPLGSFEIVFVDDGSKDATLTEIRALAARDPAVRYVSFTRNFGHQPALRAGLRHARGRAIIVLDCDFQNPPESIPDLVAAWKSGAKVVVTKREYSPLANSFLKRTTSKLYYRVLNSLGDIEIDPGSADFYLLDRAAVDAINAFESQEIFLRGLVRWIGFPMATVTYPQAPRAAGESSYNLRRMIDLAVTGIIAHSVRPLRLAIHLALIFAGFGGVLVLYSIVSFLWIDHTVVGWTSLMAAVAILGAAQLLVLGIVGEYVGRILRETRHWPTYLIAGTEASGERAESGAIDIRQHRAR